MAARVHGISSRGFTAIETTLCVSVVGSLLAIGVPAFIRELHASRFVEPVDGLARIGAGALAYAHEHPGTANAFPKSAPLSPPTPPRGTRQADPPGIWQTPTWQALNFQPVADGIPHAYSFAFDAMTGTTESSFVAHAHGDLDGDGIFSTFEIRGRTPSAGDHEAQIDPGMYVEAECE